MHEKVPVSLARSAGFMNASTKRSAGYRRGVATRRWVRNLRAEIAAFDEVAQIPAAD
jgi:hypothetical protein